MKLGSPRSICDTGKGPPWSQKDHWLWRLRDSHSVGAVLALVVLPSLGAWGDPKTAVAHPVMVSCSTYSN